LDLERAISEGAVFAQDMALKAEARFNTFDIMGSIYIGARR
jgi:hypothetical protein